MDEQQQDEKGTKRWENDSFHEGVMTSYARCKVFCTQLLILGLPGKAATNYNLNINSVGNNIWLQVLGVFS